MRTVQTIFNDFGGPANLGRAIGKTTEHAASMRRRRSIPVKHWSKLLEAASLLGIPLDEAVLLEAHKIRVDNVFSQ